MECLTGARWVQDEILKKYPNAHFRVYVVWLPVWAGDSPSKWDAALLDDSRVTHFWDDERLVGRWFTQYGNLDGARGVAKKEGRVRLGA